MIIASQIMISNHNHGVTNIYLVSMISLNVNIFLCIRLQFAMNLVKSNVDIGLESYRILVT